MRLDWINDILAILDSSSVNTAAQVRNVSQPAFSRRLKALENLLNFEIIDRSCKPAQASKPVKLHEVQIREISTRLEGLISDMRRESQQGGSRIIIASQHSITTSFATSLVGRLTAQYDMQVQLRSANRNDCHSLLLTHQVDMALTYQVPGERETLGKEFTETLEICDEQLVPICAAAQSGPLVAGRLPEQLPVIVYPANVFFGEIFNSRILTILNQLVTIRPIAETALTLAALQLGKAGIGLAWVPRLLAADEITRGTVVDLSNVLPSTHMQLVATRLTGRKTVLENEVWMILKNNITGGRAGLVGRSS